jgi:hypothetical protein
MAQQWHSATAGQEVTHTEATIGADHAIATIGADHAIVIREHIAFAHG